MQDARSPRQGLSLDGHVDILFLITDLAVGGAENQVQDLARLLTSKGWKVSIVSLMPPSIPVGDLLAAGIDVEDLHLRRGSWNPWSIVRFRHIVRRRRPRLVHSHMVHANLLARITRPLSGSVPLISTSHNVHEGGRLRTLALRLTDRLSTRTTHVSRTGLSRYLRESVVDPARAMWIPNGVDLDRFSPSRSRRTTLRQELGLSDERFVWLSVASLTRQKGHDRLLHAFAQLPDDPVLVVAGVGPESSSLQELAQRLGVQDRVRFLGVRSDPEALMDAADAFVLSSRWEGLPLVLMEAAASQLPVVAIDVGGCRELVHDGVTGFLVPPDDGGRLARAMGGLMGASEAERQKLGEAGRSLMQSQFDIEAVVARWEDVYRQVARTDGL